MSEQSPFFSIIIPTRNRDHFLAWSLQSVLQQSYADFEVIVSDNGQDKSQTQNLVTSLNDARIHYVTPDHDLSMSENWEFGLRHAKGKYIGVLIDKTLFLPDALKTCHKALEKENFDVISFGSDGFIFHDESSGELGGIYQPSWNFNLPAHGKLESYLQRIMSFSTPFGNMEDLYYYGKICFGFFSSEIIEKSVQDRRFFNGFCPDFSSLAQASKVSKSFKYIGMPLILSINSQISNGGRERVDPNNTKKFIGEENTRLFPIEKIHSAISNFIAYDLNISLKNENRKYNLRKPQYYNLLILAEKDLQRYDLKIVQEQVDIVRKKIKETPWKVKATAAIQRLYCRAPYIMRKIFRKVCRSLPPQFAKKNICLEDTRHKEFCTKEHHCNHPLEALAIAHAHYSQFKSLPYYKV